MSDLSSLREAVVATVKEAGEIILDHSRKPRDIRHKGRIDLVTATDVAVETFLKEKLPALLPGSAFMGEESAPDTPLQENTWIVDPVDGTTNYTHGLPFVATSVALWRGNDIVLGVVNAPFLNTCFTAIKGRGAFQDATPMHVSPTEDLVDSVIATGFPYQIEPSLPVLMPRVERVLSATQGIRRYGAASLDLAYVAAGHFEGYYETSLHPWDLAAGWLLVREAGGTMTRMDGSAFFLHSSDLLATNGKIHGALHGLL